MLYYLGCPRIYLLGMDLGWTDKKYAWEEHNSGGQGEFVKINDMLCELAPVFQKAGFKVYNCNRNSNCTAFEYRSILDAYDDCKGAIPDDPLDLHGWYPKGIKHENLTKYPDAMSDEDLKRQFSEARAR